MTKIEREILGKKISDVRKSNKYLWQDLKDQIADYGYQEYYFAQDEFKTPISNLVEKLDESQKKILINEWKQQKQRFQFETNEEYLEQYKLFIMEELVQRASKSI